MKFSRFCDYLEKLEKTSSKISMARIIGEMFKEAKAREMKGVAYMSLGNIGPESEHITTNMAHSMIITSIALASGGKIEKVKKDYKKIGDVGDLAEYEIKGGRNPFRKYFRYSSPNVAEVYEGMRKLASVSGKSSQANKQKILAAILITSGKKGRRYAARLAAGIMRMGVGDMTLLDGLSRAYKIPKAELEDAYYKCGDIGEVAEMAAKGKVSGVGTTISKPIRSMLAQRVKEIEKIEEKMPHGMAVEEKYDGERIQAHKKGKTVKLFSRRLTDITNQFPEVVHAVKKINRNSVILDGEAVAYDYKKKEYLKFQKLMQRRRKYRVDEYAASIPARYMVFDILYDGKSLLKKKYSERRKLLEKIVKKGRDMAPAGRIVTKDIRQMDRFFHECLKRNLEGVICKNPESIYRPGAREWSWIKWKREYASKLADTFDVVVVGAFRGRGKRRRTYGALLCAVYNKKKDVFQTFTKVGTGFTDKELAGMMKKLKTAESDKKPARVESIMKPDQWFRPVFVMEVAGAEITTSPVHTASYKNKKGLALRFPRFKRWRNDKKAEQATTAKEVERMKS